MLTDAAAQWPADSPGAANAWILLVTTKPPTWRDPYVLWRDAPPTVGEPHEGFFYPDPLGFWAEVRHWATVATGLPTSDALSVAALLHGGGRLDWAVTLMRPRVVLFLDEPAWQSAQLDISGRPISWHIPDPFRTGQVYEGWWARTVDGRLAGKAPQHPAAHNLYRRDDMDDFLQSAISQPALAPGSRSSG